MIDRGKRSTTLSEVKLIENISKNLQGFLEISPVQKEVLLSHKLQDHAYDLIFAKIIFKTCNGSVSCWNLAECWLCLTNLHLKLKNLIFVEVEIIKGSGSDRFDR